PAMPMSAAMSVPSTPARAELVRRLDRAARLQLELCSNLMLRGLRGRHRRTERKSRREYDSNRFHILLLLFAGITPANRI
ncbi:MAG: hypothetical protein ABW198_12280, partial [Pseudorhodoplanes sp.]